MHHETTKIVRHWVFPSCVTTWSHISSVGKTSVVSWQATLNDELKNKEVINKKKHENVSNWA